MRLSLRAIQEVAPGEQWRAHVAAVWPAYERWWLCEGEAARPTYLACERALRTHMPEIVPLWEALVALAGGSDIAARCLSGFQPPPYMAGCSQAVWLRANESPMLIRNYDYLPEMWEGVVWHTRWRGPAVLGLGDCMWGLLDGINEAGLCVSLAFGGRREVGVGFGIPIVLRYVLEVCTTAAEAVEVLSRVPCHMAYTITVLDAAGLHATVFLTPGQPVRVTSRRVATNHQGEVHWVQHAMVTGSVDRLAILARTLHQPTETVARFAARFLEPPTWSDATTQGWGTLYTALYWPQQRAMELRWPGCSLPFAIDAFEPGQTTVTTLPR